LPRIVEPIPPCEINTFVSPRNWVRTGRGAAGIRCCQPLLLVGALLCKAALASDGPKAPRRSFVPQDEETIAHLNAAVGWYHQVQSGSGWLLQPSDVFYWNSQRSLAVEALKGAFASAQAADALIARQAPPAAAGNAREARLSARLASNHEQLDKLQRERADLDERIRAASDAIRPGMLARRDILQAEIDLDSALAQSLERASALLANSADESDAGSMVGRIAALKRSLPEAFDASASVQAKNQPSSVFSTAASEGLANRAAALFSMVRSERAMDNLLAQTAGLQAGANRLAEPLAAAFRQTVKEGENASEQAEQAADPAQLGAVRGAIEDSAVRLRELSAALLPLRQETMALERTRANLTEWRRSFGDQTDAILRILFMRAISVAATLAILVAISEIWRRATFRYVHDLRRRRQFLIIRRFATGTLMGIVVIMGFVSDFGSLATFAGFITAGIAVALQTVILSVAAYFFLIGRYGVRVGDRVTVSGVTGDVIDIGLVRVFLLELAGTGMDLHQTGRIVVLANSALFSAVPLYKQLPGTEYTWHEVCVDVAPEGDATLAQERLLAAVDAVYSGYRTSLELQHNAVERLIDLKLEIPMPAAQLRFTDSGLEIVVRYPVQLRQIPDIDGAITRKILDVISKDAALKKSLGGIPRIRSAVRG